MLSSWSETVTETGTAKRTAVVGLVFVAVVVVETGVVEMKHRSLSTERV